MDLQVTTETGSASETIQVSDQAFGREFNEPLIHQVVTAYLAGARAGTRGHKNRTAVRGGGSKPWRQKGTGRARAGSIRSPLWRGGGKTFAIQANQDFSQKLNKKMYKSAMRSILSELVRQERLTVVSDFSADAPKTKTVAGKLNQLGATKALIVIDEDNENLYLSARNIPNVDVCLAREINPVALLRPEKVIVTAAALKQVEEMFG